MAVYGLDAGSAPQIGVYAVTSQSSEGMRLRQVEAATLEVDDGASFITLELDQRYGPGGYCVVVQADPAYDGEAGLSHLGAARCFEVTK
jgi:hypothetical protein